jgi:hypothetical protein
MERNVEKDKESMTEKRNQRELLWFQTGGALNFITAAPHFGVFYQCYTTTEQSCLSIQIMAFVFIWRIARQQFTWSFT